MKGSRAEVPESEMKVYHYVTQEMQRRIDALPKAADPVPAGGG
jgi:hypothetical protein